MDERARVDLKANVAGLDVQGALHRRNKGRTAYVDRVQSEENVMHRGIEDDCKVIYRKPCIRAVLLHFSNHFPDDLVQPGYDSVLHRLEPFGVGHGISYPRHNVLTVGHLGVHHGFGVDHLSCGKIAEITYAGSRPDVDGQTVTDIHMAGLYLY